MPSVPWADDLLQGRKTPRLGELSKGLDKAERVRTDPHPSKGKQTKAKTAGILTSAAHRYAPLRGLTATLLGHDRPMLGRSRALPLSPTLPNLRHEAGPQQ